MRTCLWMPMCVRVWSQTKQSKYLLHWIKQTSFSVFAFLLRSVFFTLNCYFISSTTKTFRQSTEENWEIRFRLSLILSIYLSNRISSFIFICHWITSMLGRAFLFDCLFWFFPSEMIGCNANQKSWRKTKKKDILKDGFWVAKLRFNFMNVLLILCDSFEVSYVVRKWRWIQRVQVSYRIY